MLKQIVAGLALGKGAIIYTELLSKHNKFKGEMK